MLIINADDFGRSWEETDVAHSCIRRGQITSVTAMVFMHDSERAAIGGRRRSPGRSPPQPFTEI